MKRAVCLNQFENITRFGGFPDWYRDSQTATSRCCVRTIPVNRSYLAAVTRFLLKSVLF